MEFKKHPNGSHDISCIHENKLKCCIKDNEVPSIDCWLFNVPQQFYIQGSDFGLSLD